MKKFDRIGGPIGFSHSQFQVYDSETTDELALLWTEEHVSQRFARRSGNVAFGLPEEFGTANVWLGEPPFTPDVGHISAVQVPIECDSGTLVVSAPEENDSEERRLSVTPGCYMLTGAVARPRLEDEEAHLRIEIYIEPIAQLQARSRILYPADLEGAELLETTELIEF